MVWQEIPDDRQPHPFLSHMYVALVSTTVGSTRRPGVFMTCNTYLVTPSEATTVHAILCSFSRAVAAGNETQPRPGATARMVGTPEVSWAGGTYLFLRIGYAR